MLVMGIQKCSCQIPEFIIQMVKLGKYIYLFQTWILHGAHLFTTVEKCREVGLFLFSFVMFVLTIAQPSRLFIF